MQTQQTQVKALALVAGVALGLAWSGAVRAQVDGGPAYRPSRYPGVNVRSVPEPQAAALPPVRQPNRGIVLRNRRRVQLPRGGTAEIGDIDPTSLPHQTATVTREGKLALHCFDPSHKHLTPSAHATRHGRPGATKNARRGAKSIKSIRKVAKSAAKASKRASR